MDFIVKEFDGLNFICGYLITLCSIILVLIIYKKIYASKSLVWVWGVTTAMFREYLAGKAFPWNTRETFCSASLYYLIHTFCTHTIYTHITHNCWGELLRENPSQKPWELEIAIPTYLYTFCLWIFLNSYHSTSISLRGW